MNKLAVGQLAKGQIVEFVIISEFVNSIPQKHLVVRAKIVKRRKLTTDLHGVNDDSMWALPSDAAVTII